MTRNFMQILAMGTALAGAVSSTAAAQGEIASSGDNRQDLSITIYNENLALVRDVRAIKLPKGESRLAFEDVSAQIRPETAALSGGGLKVLEQNFDYDLLTPEKLLEKAVGREVRIYRANPTTGADSVEKATVLSANDGVVLRIGDRIEVMGGANLPGRIVFDKIPPNLRARPTLSMTLMAPKDGSQKVELTYLTGGLGWKADYVGKLNEAETQLDLTGLITLSNHAGINFENAQTQLVAGDVNVVQPPAPPRMYRIQAEAAKAGAQDVAEEGLLDYHLYTLPRRTTVANAQTKQVTFLTAEKVKVAKTYGFEAYGFQTYDDFQSANVTFSFDNKDANNLGLPLPKGIVRLYTADSKGRAQFIGEDRIQHVPKNEQVTLDIGRAFDITVRSRTLDNEVIARNANNEVREISQEYILKNAKDQAVEVNLDQGGLWGDWTVLASSIEPQKLNSSTARFKVGVPAGGETTLKLKVRLKR